MGPERTLSRPTQAVILAGGRGERMRPLTDMRPKPMIEFHGKPFLEYLVEMLRDAGFERVTMLVGYLADVIVDHFGGGSRLGIEIDYSRTPPDDLTSKRMQVAASGLDPIFLLMYCDNYWPMRWAEMWDQYVRSECSGQVTVYANRHGFSRSSVIVRNGKVEVFDRERVTPGLEGVEISYAILDRDVVLPLLPDHQEVFEQAVYPVLAQRGDLGAYWTEHRYYSVGSLERLPVTEEFLARRPAVIVDRDGTLNKRPPRAEYVRGPADFTWLPGALDALRLFTEAGFKVIVVSNQAGINRGALTLDELGEIHASMHADVRTAGGRIDAVYYCPHDWDEGCECRKPRPGLLYQAQREHHLDLTRTFFLGDDERDGEAAEAAGCPFALVSEETPLLQLAQAIVAARLEAATA
jgi:histidinol-phosphate phosphatase family protein